MHPKAFKSTLNFHEFNEHKENQVISLFRSRTVVDLKILIMYTALKNIFCPKNQKGSIVLEQVETAMVLAGDLWKAILIGG